MKLLSYRIWVLIFGIVVAAAIATVLLMSDGGKSIISGKNISGKEGKTAGWFVVKKVKNLPQIIADQMR